MVDLKGELQFSPNHTFKEIDIALKNKDKLALIDAFKDRISGFYLNPAKELNKNDFNAFAMGILCVSTIDCLACIINCKPQVGKRFEEWVRKNLTEFDKPNPDNKSKTLAYRFYDEFRCGLVHEGRIKNSGQFSYKYNELVCMLKGVMLVNPDIMLKKINDSFEIYISKVKTEDTEFEKLNDYLENFDKEIEYANSC